MPPLGNPLRPVVVTALPTSTGSGGIVRLSADNELYEDAATGWRMLRALDATNRFQMPLATSSVPPAANTVALAARKSAGRVAVSFMDPYGIEAEIQSAIWGNHDVLIGGSNAFGGFGASVTTVGTGANLTPDTGSYRGTLPRMAYTSAAAAGSAAGLRFGTNSRWRGNAAAMGGFHVVMRHALTLVAAHRVFIGLAPTAVLGGEPSAIANMIGIGADSTDTNLFLMRRTASGTINRTDLGIAKTTNNVLRLVLYAPANADFIGVAVYNENSQALLYDAVVTDDLPLNTVLLAPQAQVHTGASSTAAVIETVRITSGAPIR